MSNLKSTESSITLQLYKGFIILSQISRDEESFTYFENNVPNQYTVMVC